MELYVSLTRRAHDRPGLSLISKPMAWRPYENLIDGELNNTIPGKVTGWMRFYRSGQLPLQVTFDLTGDFHEDIRGKVIRLKNEAPLDRNVELDRKDTYMDGFAPVQRGTAGDITAGLSLGLWTEELAQKLMAQNELIWDQSGLTGTEREDRRKIFAECYRQHIAQGDPYYPYVDYPYIEWYSDHNGRVVLELDPSQVEIVGSEKTAPKNDKTTKEPVGSERRSVQVLGAFLGGIVESFPDKMAQKDSDSNATDVR